MSSLLFKRSRSTDLTPEESDMLRVTYEEAVGQANFVVEHFEPSDLRTFSLKYFNLVPAFLSSIPGPALMMAVRKSHNFPVTKRSAFVLASIVPIVMPSATSLLYHHMRLSEVLANPNQCLICSLTKANLSQMAVGSVFSVFTGLGAAYIPLSTQWRVNEPVVPPVLSKDFITWLWKSVRQHKKLLLLCVASQLCGVTLVHLHQSYAWNSICSEIVERMENDGGFAKGNNKQDKLIRHVPKILGTGT